MASEKARLGVPGSRLISLVPATSSRQPGCEPYQLGHYRAVPKRTEATSARVYASPVPQTNLHSGSQQILQGLPPSEEGVTM